MTLEYYSATLVKTPIRYPYLFNQALRYIKEDRIIKGNKKALLALNSSYFELDYPFLHRLVTTDTETLLCRVQPCYTNLNESFNLSEELSKTL